MTDFFAPSSSFGQWGGDSAIEQVKGVWLPKADTHFHTAIEKTGSYLPERIQAAISYCQQHRLAVDVGAHVGIYTMEMMNVFDTVYAFEPGIINYACLERNVTAATEHSSATIALAHCALGHRRQWGALIPDEHPKRVGNSGAQYLQLHRDEEEGDIPVKPLDEWDLPACDLLKIDVEGMELDVLHGAYNTITQHHPVIMLEIGKVPETRYDRAAEEPLRYLEALGWSMVLEMIADKVLIWQPPSAS